LERVRTRIATDLHDDIGSSLSQIALLSEVARRRVNGGGATVSEPLERIAEVSRGLVDSITEIVWAIHPHRDKSSDLIQRMRRFAADVFTGSNIEYRFETSGTGKDIRLGADVRRHIYLVFKEAINNIVRHSGCVHASIRLELLRDCVRLVISDDGRGFAGSPHPAGHGLASMRRRAQAVGAELEIASGEGRGCEIRVRVPIAGRWISSLPSWHKRWPAPCSAVSSEFVRHHQSRDHRRSA